MRLAPCIWCCLSLARLASGSGPSIVNIQDFGAVPDDGQDDTAAIQAAFN